MPAASQLPPDIILASTSKYRRKLLSQLEIPFSTQSPNVDESALPGEAPSELARRLAQAKARAVAAQNPTSLVIASDQVAELDGKALCKPGSVERAEAQLLAASGRSVLFHTGLCVINGEREHLLVEEFRVRFRTLTAEQIHRYVAREQPLDCAGSFKAEGLGITLFESLSGRDPNTLIGLPLIALTDILLAEKYPIL